MSSVLTNLSAMSAVQNLAATQQSLSMVENQISTGLKVASASDNAAYYSIATTMRTNVGNLSAVSDSLNLGSSVVSTASGATTNVTSILQSISKALVSASQPGTDLDSVQTNINALRAQLANTISSASFNNVNLLDGSNSANPNVQFVAGVTGSGANTAVNTLTINTTNTNLQGAAYSNNGTTTLNAYANAFSANTVAQAALPAAQTANASALSALTSAITALTGNDLGNASGTQAAVTTANSTAAFQAVFGAGASMTNAGVVTGIGANSVAGKLLGSGGTGEQIALTLGSGQGTAAAGDTVSTYANGTGVTGGTLTALYGASATNTTTVATATGGVGAAANTAKTNLATATAGLTAADQVIANGALFAISQISLTSGGGNAAAATSQATIAAYISQVGAAGTAVNNASEILGAAASNISLQSTYTTSLSNNLTAGVGSLVDADMNAASTRLSALQTQQQLGVQALSVANQNSQLILKLFGG